MTDIILITGGSRGIGRATAILAARRGWCVGVNYRDNERAAMQTVADVESLGGRGVALQADVSEEPQVTAMFDRAIETFGGLTGVVNNAGIVGPAAPLCDISADRLRRMFAINVYGAFLCAREGARRLAKDRGGRGGTIVNVSSAASRLGSPLEYVDYAACKGAMDTLTIGLAKELGPHGVRVNAVRPAFIETDIHASGGRPDRAAVLGRRTPLGRAGTAEEVAEAIIWLMSDSSSFVTGTFIDISGGV